MFVEQQNRGGPFVDGEIDRLSGRTQQGDRSSERRKRRGRALVGRRKGKIEFGSGGDPRDNLQIGTTADGKQLGWEALDECIWRIRLVLVDDPDVAAHCTTASDTGLMFQVPKPGRYRCEFPPLSGFDVVPPFEVSALRGERVDQEVVLQRKK